MSGGDLLQLSERPQIAPIFAEEEIQKKCLRLAETHRVAADVSSLHINFPEK